MTLLMTQTVADKLAIMRDLEAKSMLEWTEEDRDTWEAVSMDPAVNDYLESLKPALRQSMPQTASDLATVLAATWATRAGVIAVRTTGATITVSYADREYDIQINGPFAPET